MKFRNVEFNDGHLRFQFVNSQEEGYDPAQEFYNEWDKLQTIQKEKERREKKQEKFLKKCEKEIKAEYKKVIRELVASSGYSFKPDMNYFKTLENGFLLKDVKSKFYLLFNMEKNKAIKFRIIEKTADAYIVENTETGRVGVLDKEGKIIIPIECSHIYETENGYIVCIEDFLKGVYDKQGKVIIPTKYSYITETENGYIVVTEDYLEGVYNKQGREIIPIKYNEIFGTKNGYIVEKDERGTYSVRTLRGVYNSQGKIILPIKDWKIRCTRDDSEYIVSDRLYEKYGVMNSEGKFIIPRKWNLIEETENGYIVERMVRSKDHRTEFETVKGFYNNQGKLIIPLMPCEQFCKEYPIFI